MSYYHETKDSALLAGAIYAEHFHTRVEFVPYNGWVLVLQPKSIQVFEWPLAPILAHAEIDMTGWLRLAKPPADRKRPPSASAARVGAAKAPKPPAPPPAPPRAATPPPPPPPAR